MEELTPIMQYNTMDGSDERLTILIQLSCVGLKTFCTNEYKTQYNATKNDLKNIDEHGSDEGTITSNNMNNETKKFLISVLMRILWC